MYCELLRDDDFESCCICIYREPNDKITFNTIKQALYNSIEFCVYVFGEMKTFEGETHLPFELEDGTSFELTAVDIALLTVYGATTLYGF